MIMAGTLHCADQKQELCKLNGAEEIRRLPLFDAPLCEPPAPATGSAHTRLLSHSVYVHAKCRSAWIPGLMTHHHGPPSTPLSWS